MYDRIARELASRRWVGLAVIVGVEGSAPAHEGSHLVLFEDGSRIGTVGGGAPEADVLARLQRGEHGVVAYELGADAVEPGLLCGGAMRVRLDRLGDEECAGFAAVAAALGRGESAVLAYRDHRETVRPIPRMIALGAGHVGAATLAVASAAGLRTAVADDRASLVSGDRFSSADARLALTPRAALEQLRPTPADAVLVAMRSVELDFEAVAAAAASPAFYVGLIGSRRKWDSLRERVPVGAERVRCPAGLALGGRAPGAIAVAVVAEVLSVWHSGAVAPVSR